jgi:hypothetical protein
MIAIASDMKLQAFMRLALCHPEHSEGSLAIAMKSKEILRCAQDDKRKIYTAIWPLI